MRKVIVVFVSSILFSSCIVSKKKFDDILAQKIKAESELADKTKKLDEANTSVSAMNETLKKLKQDSTDVATNLQISSKKLSELNNEYEKLNANYKSSLNKSGKLSA